MPAVSSGRLQHNVCFLIAARLCLPGDGAQQAHNFDLAGYVQLCLQALALQQVEIQQC